MGTGASTVVVTVLNTSVGISETAPGSKLSVSGNGSYGTSYDTIAAPTDGLIVEGKAGFGTSSPFSRLSVQGPSSAATTSLFAVASSTKATLFNVLGNGNVGIGTSSPSDTLTLNGSANITGDIKLNNTSRIYLYPNDTNHGIGYNYASAQNGPVIFGWDGVALYSTKYSRKAMKFSDTSDSNVYLYNKTYIGTNQTATVPLSMLDVAGGAAIGSSYALTIAAPTDGLIVEGKAGFGTSSPFSRLSVQGPSSAATTSLFAVASSTKATLFNVLGNGNVGIGTTSPWGRLSVLNTGTDNSFVVADDSNDSTPFVIDAGGNVGIGTLTPGYSLDLSGGSIGSTNGAVLIEASSLGSTGIVKIGDVQGTGNGAFVTVDDSSTYHYAFDNLEEVGGGEYFVCLKPTVRFIIFFGEQPVILQLVQ